MKDQNHKEKIDLNFCDPAGGTCSPSALQEAAADWHPEPGRTEVIYVGDPMCSWCYGLSPSLVRLRKFLAREGVAFRLVVGGLRPGGGDPWDARKKETLRYNWEQVYKKSSQPFDFSLFELDHFDYDTEPACRAVVAARPLVGVREQEFFEAISKKFYAKSKDPKEIDFYQSICREFEIDFTLFKKRFEDGGVKREAFAEFDLNRRWGVQSFPAVLLFKDDTMRFITHGYSTFEAMEKRLRDFLG